MGIAAGVETMTSNPMKWEGGMNPRVASSSDAQSCLIPMGVTSENIAEKWCVYFNSRMSNSTDAVFCSQVNHPRATGHARGEVARARRRRAEKRPVRLADRPGPHAVARSQDERGDTHPRREGRRHSRGHHPGELILFLFILLFSHFNFCISNWTEQFVFNSHRIPSPSCPPFSRRADPPPLETRRKSPTAPGAWSSRGVRTPTPKVCPSWDGSYPSPLSVSTPKSWVSFFLFSYGKLD